MPKCFGLELRKIKILGIDPGTAITGYGVIDYNGRNLQVYDYGTIRTDSKLELPQRLSIIYRSVKEIIQEQRPDHVAIEELFFNKNAKTALAVGHARGVSMLAAVESGLPVFEYTPLQVKLSVVGQGRAVKEQVQYMIKALLCLKEIPKPDDVADALAVGICHAFGWSAMEALQRNDCFS